MIDDKWFDLMDAIETKFKIIERSRDEITDKESGKVRGDVQSLVFMGPQGKMKIERVSRFAILSEKVLYHRHAKGSQIERTYSDTEKTHRVNLYKWNERLDDWEELNLSEMFRH